MRVPERYRAADAVDGRLLPPDAEHSGQHRECELAVSGLRVTREELADPTECGPAFLLGHDQHPCPGRECCDERIGGAALPVRELVLLRRTEPGDHAHAWKVHACGRSAPAAVRVTRPNGRAPADSLEPRNPVDPVVEHVPQASQNAVGYENPGDLRPATSMSNQCRALPANTASTDASGSGIASALPGRARTVGSALRNSLSIAGSGSTAMTWAPNASSVAVSLPVPAPRSSTRPLGAGESAHRTAGCA
jgi:hypothetical protein